MAMRMHLGENARMALGTLRENKMRSFLAVLGVVIGVTALVSVCSILVGLDRDIRSYLNDFGTDTLFIFKFEPGIHTGRLTAEERSRKPLTLEDAMTIREMCPSIKEVSADIFPRVGSQRGIVTARYRGKEVSNVNYYGTLPTNVEVENVRLAKGRFFTESENLHRAGVAVLGYDLADGLFGAEDPLDKTITVNGVPFVVIGVMERHKGQLFGGGEGDRDVRIPFRTYNKHYPADDEVFISAMAFPGRMTEAEDEIRGVLRRRRNVAYNKSDNFGISSAAQIADQFRQITSSIALLISVIASIGLLIGGVGVMNIMLMSVTQRTREIGVRKAIGARRSDVIWQFLTEAMTLTGGGGLIGVLMSIGISLLLNALLPSLPSVVPLWAVVLGVAVSMSVGLFFGMYPAIKAARLDPVDALRYE
jgi:putative ABC transport system permease protein